MLISKIRYFLSLAAFLCVCAATANAADWYVSANTGSNKNDGSMTAPFKNIWKAIDKAANNDVIHIAGGEYYGRMSCGWIEMKKPVSLIGSYTDDFSSRNVQEHPTCLRPKNEQFATRPQAGTLTINTAAAGDSAVIVIDGLVFDHTAANSYHATKGKPEGIEHGMLMIPPAKGNSKSPSIDKALCNAKTSGTLTITNCLFLNGSNYALLVAHRSGTVNVVNNVFIGNRMAAADVRSTNGQPDKVTFNFDYNTVFFTWPTKVPFETMGMAVRANDKTITNIRHNILGLNCMAGFDNTKGNDRTKKITLEDNIFFLNRTADVAFTISPSIKFMKVEDDGFEDIGDLECMVNVSGNTGLKDPALFKGVLDKAFLDAFLSIAISEDVQYDENSPINQFREAMGLNKQGKISIKATMFGNPYPYDSAIRFFGTVPECGAQGIKY